MKIVVVGYGSIGQRHARNLKALGHEVILLRYGHGRPNTESLKEYHNIQEIFEKEKDLRGAVICSPTSEHARDVKKFLDHDIPFFLEKPPTQDLSSALALRQEIQQKISSEYDLGFNMRHYPILKFIKDFLPQLGKIYSARIYAGYYLPYWRKGVDYRATSSARKELGGGVHIELIHEIDYMLWFFGLPSKVSGYIQKVSGLEISTEDICSAIVQYNNGPMVELHLDYLSQKYMRGCQMIAEGGTLEWDMGQNKVVLTKGQSEPQVMFSLPENYDFNDTYLHEMKNFIQMIEKDGVSTVDIDAAVDAMAVVEAIKISSCEERTVYLKDVLAYQRIGQ